MVMKFEDQIKLLTTVTDNNDFLDYIRYVREKFQFPHTGFASPEAFKELNAEYKDEPAHGITRAEMDALGIKSLWQARITDEQIDEAITRIISRFGFDPTVYIKSVIGDFLIYGKAGVTKYDPRAQWAAEWYYDKEQKRWRNYLYFRIYKSTRRDSFRRYWNDQEHIIETMKRRLPEDAPLLLVALNEGEHYVEAYISRHTTRTYIEEHWSEIAEQQKRLSGYQKQRPVKISNYLRVSKNNIRGIKKNTAKKIKQKIKRVTSGRAIKNRE